MTHALLTLLALTTSTAMSQECCAPEPPPGGPRHLDIEFLYLDLTECTRCVDTGTGLAGAIEILAPVLKETGFEVRLRKIHVTSAAQAQEFRFASSPTVRINGTDTAFETRESPCTDCGDLCQGGASVTCREWRYRDRWMTSPPRALFVEAILGAMMRPAAVAAPASAAAACCSTAAPCCSPAPAFELPENLKRFFAVRAAAARDAGCCAPTSGAKAAPACCEPPSGSPKSGECCPAGTGCCGK